jgi:hypothetical protein
MLVITAFVAVRLLPLRESLRYAVEPETSTTCATVLTTEQWQVLWLTDQGRRLPLKPRHCAGPVWPLPSWADLPTPNAPGVPGGTPSGTAGHVCRNGSREYAGPGPENSLTIKGL